MKDIQPIEIDSKELPSISMPERYNYLAAFLTLSCDLNCSYCINSFGNTENLHQIHNWMMPGSQWIKTLNRLELPSNIPVTLCGGEPSLHPDFYDIINGLKPELNIDILTNLQFDIKRFLKKVHPKRVSRDAPYASIRISYHPEVMTFNELKEKIIILIDNGYSVGLWSVAHPLNHDEIERVKNLCVKAGINFRVKEFLGIHQGKVYGRYKYPGSVEGKQEISVKCRISELIIGPSGNVFRCHSDLYRGRQPIGNISDSDFVIEDVFRHCENYGSCNPCDVKIKTNRFQQNGHTSVEIQFKGSKDKSKIIHANGFLQKA